MAELQLIGDELKFNWLNIDFDSLWDKLPYGVMVINNKGIIVFYSKQQSIIDGLSTNEVLGKHIKEVFGPDPGPSPVLTCLARREPIIDFVCVYRTMQGRLINSSHSVFPLHGPKGAQGCICFTRTFDKLADAKPYVSVAGNLQDNLSDMTFDDIIATSQSMLDLIESTKASAHSPSPIMLCGETGTGKDIFARCIHAHSTRRSHPYVAMNCSAIPAGLLEGILFGTSRGSYTGAKDKPGLFEQASGGTIFLDELDSMPLNTQPKLLRVLQDKKVRRLGSTTERELNLKVISAVSSDPHQAMQNGSLRPDLFYRLGVVVISLPPLRERLSELKDLVSYFILKHNPSLGKSVHRVSKEVLDLFRRYPWPGNIRELEHAIEGAMNLVNNQEELQLSDMPKYIFKSLHFDTTKAKQSIHQKSIESSYIKKLSVNPSEHISRTSAGPDLKHGIHHYEKERIFKQLVQTKGNVTHAANALGISRHVLTYKMKKYRFKRHDFIPQDN